MPWSLSWRLPDVWNEGTIYTACRGGRELIRLEGIASGLRIVLRTWLPGPSSRSGHDEEHTFTLEAGGRISRLTMEWREASVQLYADDRLTDEEWPLGTLLMDGVEECGLIPERGVPQSRTDSAEKTARRSMRFFLPEGYNVGVGDCMPFSHGGRFRLFYLYDRRGHRSKVGLGAHQWAQVSSADLSTWTEHPMAIAIDEQWEGSICTGSLIEREGKVYAFYAVRMSDGSPARLSCAVSDDGVRFEKSGHYLSLTAPYEPTSARDPMVFFGKDGQYHMLVTTSRMDRPAPYNGCLAHLTSPDLVAWTQEKDPFIEPGYAGQPECADYFRWGKWYYLVFSCSAAAHYRMSLSPFGPWVCPERDVLDNPNLSVPKTASFGTGRRLVSGFLRRGPLTTYAGVGITHELMQREDGTLGVKPCEELEPAYVAEDRLACILRSPEGRRSEQLFLAPGNFRLKGDLTGKGVFGIVLCRGDRETYTLRFDERAGTFDFLLPGTREQTSERLHAQNLRLRAFPLEITYHDGVLDMFYADGYSLIVWIPGEGALELSAYVHWGELTLTGNWSTERSD